jgi:hypothetical protein
MLKEIALITLLFAGSCGTSIAANPATNAPSAKPANAGSANDANVPKRAPIQGRIQKKDGSVRTPIDLGPNVKQPSRNNFNDISASMPAAAVKEGLRRKHELPNAQTSLLRPGGTVAGPSGSGAINAAQAAGSQGGATDGLRGNGVAAPDTKGAAENQFYK